MYVKRPKPSEDVEDLKRIQQEFLASQSQTSAKLQKSSNTKYSDNQGPQRKSRFKQERDKVRAQATSSLSTETAQNPSLQPLLNDLIVRSKIVICSYIYFPGRNIMKM